ncbi:MAG TPA: NADH-quinone oxidoreductase subunit C [Burkholderiaceae bacterium]|nr:NADH-quinone oxidoreductase subunit C [Burkholderiaceae bacterium]
MTAPIFDSIQTQLGSLATACAVSHGTLVVEITPSSLSAVVHTLKSACQFDMLLDVTAIDWPSRQPRFDVVWHFYSTKHRVRVRVKTQVPESEPVVESLTRHYGSAAFMERECHEMYGIRFNGNADLRPLLLYEGFVGYPLRKDYPKLGEQPLVPYREGFDIADRVGGH